MVDEIITTGDVPSYLSNVGAQGSEPLPVAQATPRLKLIQGMTDKALKKEHGEGALVLMPDEVAVMSSREPVDATPVYSWVSWQQWADLKDSAAENPVIKETTDGSSDIAAKSRDRDTREEPYQDGSDMKYRFVEAVNFIFRIETGPCEGAVAIYSFTRAQHKYGANLSRFISRNGVKGVPIYGNRVTLTSSEDTNKANQTYSVIKAKPAEICWTSEDEIAVLAGLYDGFHAMYGATRNNN